MNNETSQYSEKELLFMGVVKSGFLKLVDWLILDENTIVANENHKSYPKFRKQLRIVWNPQDHNVDITNSQGIQMRHDCGLIKICNYDTSEKLLNFIKQNKLKINTQCLREAKSDHQYHIDHINELLNLYDG